MASKGLINRFIYNAPSTCAGSSGGAQPPLGPHRLPSQCKSASAAPNREKGHNIADWVSKEGKLKMRFGEEGDTWKAIGPHAAWWDSAVGIHTRDCCDPFHEKWKNVPPQQKAQIRERLLDWFDIDFEDRNCLFLDVLNRDAKKQYKDWKIRLKNHFLTNGTVHPDSIRDDDHWRICCERFITADFQKKSKTNANNHGKHKCKSRHRRMSYIRRRVLKANAETQQLYSAIENWREMHHDGEKWINEVAERTYNAMVEMLQAPLAQFGFPVDELHVTGNVLGSHRGHRTGVGPTLSRSSRGIPRATQSRTQHASCQTEIKMLRSTLSQVLDVLHQIAPNVQLPNMPPSSSSSAANLCDDDATDSET